MNFQEVATKGLICTKEIKKSNKFCFNDVEYEICSLDIIANETS